MTTIDVSWLGSVYSRTNPFEFCQSIESILAQKGQFTSEIILVVDGPISLKLSKAISKYSQLLIIIDLDTNSGLGTALKIGFEACHGSYIFRYDTDDINLENRVHIQLNHMRKNPCIDILSSPVIEFNGDSPDKSYSLSCRDSLKGPFSVDKALNFRNPLNHPSVVIKRSAFHVHGLNYEPMNLFEDYYVWLRARKIGLCFAINTQPVVHMRVDTTLSRRYGINYALSESIFAYRIFSQFLVSPIYLPVWLLRIFLRFIGAHSFQRFIRDFLKPLNLS